VRKRTMFWSFFGAHVVLLLLAVGAVSFYNWHISRYAFMRQWVRELEMQAKTAAALLPDDGGEVDEQYAAQFFERLRHHGIHRFTLILPNGRVLGDSDVDVENMESHEDRPEVIEAFEKGLGMRQRYSASLGKQMLYVAYRLPQEGAARAVIRVAVPVRFLTSEMRAADKLLLSFFLGVLCVTLALSYVAALRITRPVSSLQLGLARIGSGNLSYRLPVPRVPHLANLARSINRNAERLQRQVQALHEERNLRAMILENMTRGVIAIDRDRCVLDINAAARALLDIGDEQKVIAKPLGERIRNPEVFALIEACEQQNQMCEGEMTIDGKVTRRLQLRVSMLNDLGGERIGSLLVFSDVTLLRRLETVRQDFVSNVSHELRTPVTSIKGFAETLLDGAVKDPEKAERFLKILVRQAGQLETTIRDLLELSRLEGHSPKALDCQRVPVGELLKNAAELCQERADKRSVTLSLSCDEGLTVMVHAGLMEQALVNLIDNAITYGTDGTQKAQVDIEAVSDGSAVSISVRDYGPGIESKHLDRLFERLYRVDKGRSRELGGTGLGLAIVKHIALIHNGSVDVESKVGKGSVFTIRLPLQCPDHETNEIKIDREPGAQVSSPAGIVR